MTLVITPFYAALSALFYLFLAKRVIDNRWKFKKGLGSVEGDLEQTIRTHGNFNEYVPLAFLLISFVEIQLGSFWGIHILGLSLLVCRLLHFLGLKKSGGPSKGRFYGTAGTFLNLVASSFILIYLFIKSQLL
ncbi:MAG: putative membrane protein YecN with MAPEG domain [Bacteriovoracaceae bacterium]|jgi:uncharacterized membrane protein YecN with MAPEG domain